jgi:Uma2 family endonuclease
MEKVITLSSYEIERGKPMPSKLHSITQSNLIFQLQQSYRNRYRFFSELSMELGDWESVPDLAIYPISIVDFSEDIIQVSEVPLGIVEIISPTQSFNELIFKAGKYFDKGVKTCWIVIPVLKSMYVFSGKQDYEFFKFEDTLLDRTLDISLSLKEVFR